MKRAFEGTQPTGKAPRVDPVSGQIDFSTPGAPVATNLMPKLTDQHKLAQRQKQIDFGKNTIGYMRFASDVRRRDRKPSDPWTPDIAEPLSKRCFDGKVKDWRRKLHLWENENPAEVAGSTADVSMHASGDGGSASTTATAGAPTLAVGLTACADDFDDFLDGALEDEEPLAPVVAAAAAQQQQQQQNSNPQQGGQQGVPALHDRALGASSADGLVKSTAAAPAAPTWSSAAVDTAALGAAAAATHASADGSRDGGADDSSGECSSLRARLDAFKNAPKAATGAGSQSAGIFGTFDDGLV
jgi:hypothetical protein